MKNFQKLQNTNRVKILKNIKIKKIVCMFLWLLQIGNTCMEIQRTIVIVMCHVMNSMHTGITGAIVIHDVHQ